MRAQALIVLDPFGEALGNRTDHTSGRHFTHRIITGIDHLKVVRGVSDQGADVTKASCWVGPEKFVFYARNIPPP